MIALCFSVLCVLVGSGWPSTSLAAQQFSADLVATAVPAVRRRQPERSFLEKQGTIEAPDFPEGLFLSWTAMLIPPIS
jgi:hypothetical protein